MNYVYFVSIIHQKFYWQFDTLNMDSIGEILIKLRRSRGLSQSALAKEIGVNRGTITSIESDTHVPTLEIAIKLANYFNTSLDRLVGRTNNNGLSDAINELAQLIAQQSPVAQGEIRGMINGFLIGKQRNLT